MENPAFKNYLLRTRGQRSSRGFLVHQRAVEPQEIRNEPQEIKNDPLKRKNKNTKTHIFKKSNKKGNKNNIRKLKFQLFCL